MIVRLSNFLCHDDLLVEFRCGEINHLAGKSGAGKTTIFEAITWCLYGNQHLISNDLGDGVSVMWRHNGLEIFRSREKLSVKIENHPTSRFETVASRIDELKNHPTSCIGTVTSGNHPTSCVETVASGDRLTSCVENPQLYIESRYGTYSQFMRLSYLQQQHYSPIHLLSPRDLLLFVEKLLFQDNIPRKLITVCVDFQTELTTKISERGLLIRQNEAVCFGLIDKHQLLNNGDIKESLLKLLSSYPSIVKLEEQCKEAQQNLQLKMAELDSYRRVEYRYQFLMNQLVGYQNTINSGHWSQCSDDELKLLNEYDMKRNILDSKFREKQKLVQLLQDLNYLAISSEPPNFTQEQLSNVVVFERSLDRLHTECSTLGVRCDKEEVLQMIATLEHGLGENSDEKREFFDQKLEEWYHLRSKKDIPPGELSSLAKEIHEAGLKFSHYTIVTSRTIGQPIGLSDDLKRIKLSRLRALRFPEGERQDPKYMELCIRWHTSRCQLEGVEKSISELQMEISQMRVRLDLLSIPISQFMTIRGRVLYAEEQVQIISHELSRMQLPPGGIANLTAQINYIESQLQAIRHNIDLVRDVHRILSSLDVIESNRPLLNQNCVELSSCQRVQSCITNLGRQMMEEFLNETNSIMRSMVSELLNDKFSITLEHHQNGLVFHIRNGDLVLKTLSGGEMIKVNLIILCAFRQFFSQKLLFIDENLVYVPPTDKIRCLKFIDILAHDSVVILTSQEIPVKYFSSIVTLA